MTRNHDKRQGQINAGAAFNNQRIQTNHVNAEVYKAKCRALESKLAKAIEALRMGPDHLEECMLIINETYHHSDTCERYRALRREVLGEE